jgi:hypothetical protein
MGEMRMTCVLPPAILGNDSALGANVMGKKEWDSATADEKIEMLREDIRMISEAKNLLAHDHAVLVRKVSELKDELRHLQERY